MGKVTREHIIERRKGLDFCKEIIAMWDWAEFEDNWRKNRGAMK